AELAAMALVHEIFHVVVDLYRRRHPASFDRLHADLGRAIGDDVRRTLAMFLAMFPPPAVYRTMRGEGAETPELLLSRGGSKTTTDFTEEVLLLWLVNQNPAYDPVRSIVHDHDLPPAYRLFVAETQRFFDHEPPFGPKGETLVELLLTPSRRA